MDFVILAAGKGTRMNSSKPKVLHEIGGKPLIEHLLGSIDPLNLSRVIAVVGYKKELIRSVLSDWDVDFAVQENQRGTAHALQQAKDKIESETFLVVPGDLPLVKTSSLKTFIDFAKGKKAELALLTVNRDDPSGYGRIKRSGNGGVEEIIEEQDASEVEKKIKEINAGIYFMHNREALWEELDSIDLENAQGEFYLTDLAKRFSKKGRRVSGFQAKSQDEFLGVNTREDLVLAGKILNRRKRNSLLNSGVTLTYPESIVIESDVTIGQDTTIEPFTIIRGETSIGSDAKIGPHVEIIDSEIGQGVELSHAVVKGTSVRDNRTIEPFSFLK
ncbi:bifunctional N-acetylglucosamine-1-phosphate uridyltransferase/glucosamine-1-phosphate acetyltransferase [Candidatus Bipolaricaulota bacterium]|nr:bifunctional N-acetylglucosamine-1-phosphate uridyltransferase/glucosamine-1-phosphate acetyltransferase [Candidatus Bipolaricaulota bacterium]